MTTIHTHNPGHTARMALASAFVLVVAVMITLAVLAASSPDVPTTGEGPGPATGHTGTGSVTDDWDVLCFKPSHRDAAPCQRSGAPDPVTRGRLP